MKARLTVILAMAAISMVAAQVLADDVFPPPFQRGSPLTTFERWEFSTPATNTPPEQMINPYGVPATNIVGTWIPVYDNRVGVWTLGTVTGGGGFMDLIVPNSSTIGQKQIWLQITYEPDDVTHVGVQVSANGVPGTFVQSTPVGPPGTSWQLDVFSIFLPDNPPSETIHIVGINGAPIKIDEAVLDTRCVPVPAAVVLGLIGLGTLGIRMRKYA